MADPTKTVEPTAEEKQLAALQAEIDKLKAIPATDQPLEIKLEDGSIYKGASKDEVITALGKAKVDTAKAMRDREEQVRRLEGQLEQYRTAAKPAESAAPVLDTAKYYALWERDPLLAQNYLDSVRFGVADPAQVPARFNRMHDLTEDYHDKLQMATFYQRCPEYLPSNDNADLILARLQTEGRDLSAENLESAFRGLVRDGKITPAAPATAGGASPAPAPGQSNAPPPSLPGAGGGGGTLPTSESFENLSTEDMEKALRSANILKH